MFRDKTFVHQVQIQLGSIFCILMLYRGKHSINEQTGLWSLWLLLEIHIWQSILKKHVNLAYVFTL